MKKKTKIGLCIAGGISVIAAFAGGIDKIIDIRRALKIAEIKEKYTSELEEFKETIEKEEV